MSIRLSLTQLEVFVSALSSISLLLFSVSLALFSFLSLSLSLSLSVSVSVSVSVSNYDLFFFFLGGSIFVALLDFTPTFVIAKTSPFTNKISRERRSKTREKKTPKNKGKKTRRSLEIHNKGMLLMCLAPQQNTEQKVARGKLAESRNTWIRSEKHFLEDEEKG